MSVILKHLTLADAQQALSMTDTSCSKLTPQPTSMVASLAPTLMPLLVLGLVSLYPSRKQSEKEHEATELESLAEQHGFDAVRLRQLQTWATGLISSKKLPGIVIAIARKGEVVFHEAYGDPGYKKDGIFSIGSMAAPIIAATLLSLVDDGRICIDDPVAKYLPYFANFRVHRSGKSPDAFKTDPLTSPITIRHLLTHTWGFPGNFYLQSGQGETRCLDALAAALNPRIGNDADFEKLTQIPLIGQPGQCYRESMGLSVVGHIICNITGQSLPEVVQERIFHPLGLVDTDWFVPAEKQHRVPAMFHAAPWLTNRLWGNRLTGEHAGHTSWLGWVAKQSQSHVPEKMPGEITGESNLYSTADDQLRFHTMLLRGGCAASGMRVLTQESVQLMTTDQLNGLGRSLSDAKFNSHTQDKANSGGRTSPQFGSTASGQGYGLGMQVVTRPVNSRLAGSRGTFSSWGFGGTECWSDPALDMSVFVGTQLSPFWAMPDLRQEVAGAIYGSMVSTSAAKYIATAQDQNQGGAMGMMMNMMMMMSMLGGGGLMGMPGGVGSGGAAAVAGAGTAAVADSASSGSGAGVMS
jgi:CubicO group peptidase (beta-lactamase class C family)